MYNVPLNSNPTLDTPIHSQFTVIYDTLPDSAKRALLEDHLLPLIDALPPTSKRTLLSTAHALQARFTQLPQLSLLSKKAEINSLLEELRLDSYRPSASSRREEISEEIVDSLVDWLSDIWQTVYEVGVDFERGHECLLYCCDVLQQISLIVSGCKCSFMDLYVTTSICGRSGGVIKEFSYPNVYLLEDAFLWIWRDMLLRILADGRQCELDAIPRMLRDIQSATKEWETALDRLLLAGTKFNSNERNLEKNCDYYDDEYFDSCCPVSDSNHCPSNVPHWPPSIHDQLPNLRIHVSTALYETFTLHPSLSLYINIVSLTPASRPSLLDHLQSTAPYSAGAAGAALDIHAYDKDATSLLATLAVARPILRARDAPALQRAARFLMKTPARAHVHTACDLIERELRGCVDNIWGAVVSRGFEGLDNARGKALWGAVQRCVMGSTQRQEAIGRWVDAIVTTRQPGVVPGHELNLAALLMGFPPGFDPDDPDPDPFLFSSIKEGHPDYEDLLEEWRPRLKERFEGWIRVAEALKNLGNKGGSNVGDESGVGMELMRRVAAEMVERMPWVGQEDVVEEMIRRLQDKPTKQHICDALYALLEFMLHQKRRELHGERRRKMAMSTKVRKTGENSTRGAGGSSGVGNSYGAGSPSRADRSTGEQPQTAPKRSARAARESLIEFLQETHKESGNPEPFWSVSGEVSTSSGGTQPVGGGSSSEAAPTTGNKTEGEGQGVGQGKGKGKGKEKEKEQQPCSFTSRYTAKEKGKGKAHYSEVSATEEETEEIGTVQNDNTEIPAYPHASGFEWGEGVASGSTLGHEDSWSQQSQSHTQTHSGGC